MLQQTERCVTCVKWYLSKADQTFLIDPIFINIRFTHAIGNSAWKNCLDDDASATSANNAESKTAAIVDKVYHFNLSPFRIQLRKRKEKTRLLLKRKRGETRLNHIIEHFFISERPGVAQWEPKLSAAIFMKILLRSANPSNRSR